MNSTEKIQKDIGRLLINFVKLIEETKSYYAHKVILNHLQYLEDCYIGLEDLGSDKIWEEIDRGLCDLPLTDVRKNFSNIIKQVAFEKKLFIVKRFGKKVAAIIPIENLEFFETLAEEYEDQLDIEAAQKALKEKKFFSLESVEAELNL